MLVTKESVGWVVENRPVGDYNGVVVMEALVPARRWLVLLPLSLACCVGASTGLLRDSHVSHEPCRDLSPEEQAWAWWCPGLCTKGVNW